jgi:hypothetical protein
MLELFLILQLAGLIVLMLGVLFNDEGNYLNYRNHIGRKSPRFAAVLGGRSL